MISMLRGGFVLLSGLCAAALAQTPAQKPEVESPPIKVQVNEVKA